MTGPVPAPSPSPHAPPMSPAALCEVRDLELPMETCGYPMPCVAHAPPPKVEAPRPGQPEAAPTEGLWPASDLACPHRDCAPTFPAPAPTETPPCPSRHPESDAACDLDAGHKLPHEADYSAEGGATLVWPVPPPTEDRVCDLGCGLPSLHPGECVPLTPARPGASLAAKLATMDEPMYPPKATAERMARFVEKHDGCSTCGAPRPCSDHPAPTAPAWPVQPTPRPEGETACEVCLRGRGFGVGFCDAHVNDLAVSACYCIGYARLRAEAAANLAAERAKGFSEGLLKAKLPDGSVCPSCESGNHAQCQHDEEVGAICYCRADYEHGKIDGAAYIGKELAERDAEAAAQTARLAELELALRGLLEARGSLPMADPHDDPPAERAARLVLNPKECR